MYKKCDIWYDFSYEDHKKILMEDALTKGGISHENGKESMELFTDFFQDRSSPAVLKEDPAFDLQSTR